MGKSSSGAAAGGGAIYGLGIFDALFYYWQQADAFWEYIWAVFPKAIFWPAFMVYGFHVSSCVVWCRPVPPNASRREQDVSKRRPRPRRFRSTGDRLL